MEAFLLKALAIVALVVGFGFVIFWHELGHFLAAKWVGIKVEQFAVGMGHALVSFRKGIGVRWGNTREEYEERVRNHLAKKLGKATSEEFTEREFNDGAAELGLGETEYRISWIPVGGYVKMLGQDDTKANSDVEDPRAFNKKSIPKRMIVVSAGVLMNILLAGILFMILFMWGFRAPASVVGTVLANSPAQAGGLEPGDTILDFDGTPMHDFTKVKLNTALAATDRPTIVHVRRANGTQAELKITPIKPEGTSKAFLAMGITPAMSLTGVKETDWPPPSESPDLEYPEMRLVRPGDTITKVNGQDVQPSTTFTPGNPGDYYKLIDAAQDSHGKPVELTIKRKDGKIETAAVQPHFQSGFGPDDFNIAGMLPRMRVMSIASAKSPVFNKFKPDDVVKSIEVRNGSTTASQPGDLATDVSVPGFIKTVGEAGAKDRALDFVVMRDGKPVAIRDVKANLKVGKDRDGNDRFGVGVAPVYEEQRPVVAAVAKDSPAAKVAGGLPAGALITAVDGRAVRTWFDVRDALSDAGDHKLTLVEKPEDGPAGKPIERTISLAKADAEAVANIRLAINPLALSEEIVVRQTGNPLTAMTWGVAETRDLILQFYVTLQRMFGGSISATNLMGPVGIFKAGADFAFRGADWLLWFLAMISANLAVVNFLPIPIVDGGLFLFLIIEKVRGRPLSRRAQEIAQYAGLVLILSVFVMVTYNDIARFFN
jgi:regulator of sigma E protease